MTTHKTNTTNTAHKIKLTQRRAHSFMPAPGREAVLWDHTVPGLGLRVRPQGRKTWIIHRRHQGTLIRRTLGTLDTLTLKEARLAARPFITDPTAATNLTAIPTLQSFAPVFLADHAPGWKPRTYQNYAHNLRQWILPVFGHHPIDSISAKDARCWHDKIAATRPGCINWALATLSALMKHAEALGLRPVDSNPCRGLRRRKTGFEAHYLKDNEWVALGRALAEAQADHPVAVAVLRFLLYTGARKSEALRLKWDHLHTNRAVLPDSKTGPRTLWLAPPARAILTAQARRTNAPWVFASATGEPVSINTAWRAVRAAAGLGTLRIHDLRHSYAAVAVNDGAGLRVVAGLLGHADIQTTFGYAHLSEGSVSKAADRVSGRLAAMLEGGRVGR